MGKAYIDCGHGGADSGAIGKSKNVFEKNIVLEVGKKVEAKLKACGIETKLSRTNDITKSLGQRTSEANKWGADVLVSIHCNDATNIGAQGIETYCYKFKYRKLADNVHAELVNAKLYTKNRGVKEGNLHMVRESNMDACLVELGFINNEDDIKLLLNKQDEFATAIAKGICKHFGVPYKETSKPNPTPTPSKDTLYRVCAIAVTGESKANEEIEKLKKLGYKDAYKIAVK